MKIVCALTLLALAACGASPAAPAAAPNETIDTAVAQIRAIERPAPSAEAERAGTHCLESESVVFSCGIGTKTASVCVGRQTVDYRYGTLGAPEITIASTGADGAAHVSTLSGAGGGSQSAVRFSNAGYDYVVHAMEAGRYTDTPGRASAGVTVLHGDATVADLKCADPAHHQFSTSDIPAQEETEERYQAWW